MRRSRTVLLLAAVFVLTGCAALFPKTIVWQKEGASPQEFSADRNTCLQQSGAPADAYGGTSTSTELFGACMTWRGWHLARQQ